MHRKAAANVHGIAWSESLGGKLNAESRSQVNQRVAGVYGGVDVESLTRETIRQLVEDRDVGVDDQHPRVKTIHRAHLAIDVCRGMAQPRSSETPRGIRGSPLTRQGYFLERPSGRPSPGRSPSPFCMVPPIVRTALSDSGVS